MNASSDSMLKDFLTSYASLSFKHHFIVSSIILSAIGLLKLLISQSAPDGIWWQALSTMNLFLVISVLMYGAIIFSQIMAAVCAQVMQVVMPGDNALAAGSVIGVTLSAVAMFFMAPFLLDLIWR